MTSRLQPGRGRARPQSLCFGVCPMGSRRACYSHSAARGMRTVWCQPRGVGSCHCSAAKSRASSLRSPSRVACPPLSPGTTGPAWTLHPPDTGARSWKSQHSPQPSGKARGAMGVTSLSQIPVEGQPRGQQDPSTISPRRVAAKRADAHSPERAPLSAEGQRGTPTFPSKVSSSRRGTTPPLWACGVVRHVHGQLRRRSLHRLAGCLPAGVTAWACSLRRPRPRFHGSQGSPFLLAGPHLSDSTANLRAVTFQRHRGLFNFQNSPLFGLLIRGSEAPAREAVLASFPGV